MKAIKGDILGFVFFFSVLSILWCVYDWKVSKVESDRVEQIINADVQQFDGE